MIYQIVAIHDNALDAYMQPWFTPHVNGAIRAFQDELNKPDSPMHKHPTDYDLYHIGEYDDQDAKLTPLLPNLLFRGTNAILK